MRCCLVTPLRLAGGFKPILQQGLYHNHVFKPRYLSENHQIPNRSRAARALAWAQKNKIIIFTAPSLAVLWAYNYWNTCCEEPALAPETFRPFTLISKEAVSSTSSIFTLRPQSERAATDIYADAWRQGVWSIQVKQPQLQIARFYTPLPPAEDFGKSPDLRFLIRQDPYGEVSNYLHKLPIGAPIDLRGPRLEYAIPDDIEEVLFLAGGTGIAPALQVVHALLTSRSSSRSMSPKVRILWANRRQEDALQTQSEPPNLSGSPYVTKLQPEELTQKLSECLQPQPIWQHELISLQTKHQDMLSLQCFVDEHRTYIDGDTLQKYLFASRKKHQTPSQGAAAGRKLILISGPDGFVNHFAGPKFWKGGIERQGPLGGVLRKLNFEGWEVWKL